MAHPLADETGHFDLPFGGHIFVLARPYDQAWSRYDGTNGMSDRDTADEFRPCMISGHNDSQRIFVIGSQYAFPLERFEIKPLLLAPEEAPADQAWPGL